MIMNAIFQMNPQLKKNDTKKKDAKTLPKQAPVVITTLTPVSPAIIKPIFSKVPISVDSKQVSLPVVSSAAVPAVKITSQELFNKTLNEIRFKHTGALPPNKKFLVLIATHTDSEIKRSSIRDNILYLRQNSNIDFAVINSSEIDGNEEMKEYYMNNDIEYYEISNDKTYDFGKWYHILKHKMQANEAFGKLYTEYDYVVLTNDSYVLSSSLSYFFNLCIQADVDIYGYNDSDEDKYHYQSYLFALKTSAVPTFCNFVETKLKKIKNQVDVINQYELKLLDAFNTYDCFLKISQCPKNNKKNVFFKNDSLYSQLKACGLLPFTKIKRILAR